MNTSRSAQADLPCREDRASPRHHSMRQPLVQRAVLVMGLELREGFLRKAPEL
jgi:hypothetical protein